MNLFKLTAKEKLWSNRDVVLVVAEDSNAAIAGMTCGSDSGWVSVETCEDLGPYTGEIDPNWYKWANAYIL